MTRLMGLLAGPVLLMFLGGCSSYVEGFRYVPHPAVAEISATPPQPAMMTMPPTTQPQPQYQPPPPPPPPPAPPLASTYANVIGVFRGSHSDNIPVSVQVRMRLENHGPELVAFDPGSLELTDGSLMRFPAPLARPGTRVTVEPGQSAVIDVFFPFPAGYSWENADLHSLQLRWAVEMNGHPVDQMAEFQRVHPRYYYYGGPYYEPYPYYGGVGVGFVYVHRR